MKQNSNFKFKKAKKVSDAIKLCFKLMKLNFRLTKARIAQTELF